MNRDSNLQSVSNSSAGDSALGHSSAPSFAGEAASLAAGGGASEAGAQPSITAPANCIRPLRHGVDGVFLSYPGGIDRHVAVMLLELKELVQSVDDHRQAGGASYYGDRIFTVLLQGRGRFTFVLEDRWSRLEFPCASASALLVAYIQARSGCLAVAGKTKGAGSDMTDEPIRTSRVLGQVARWIGLLILAAVQ